MGDIRLGGKAFVAPVIPYSRWDGTDEFGGWVTEKIYGVPRTGGGAGANARVLTAGATFDVCPEPSPDGLKVAYLPNGAQINILDVATLADDFLVGFDEGATFGATNSRHRWSPDGTTIAYLDVEQFPSRSTFYSIPADGSALKTQLVQWSPGASIGDFGWAYDGSVIVFRDPVTETLWTVEPDGSNATDTGLAIDAGASESYRNRITTGHVSDLVVYVDYGAAEIRKCAIDGTGDTLVQSLNANTLRWRFSNHILSGDDSTVVYTFDTLNWATGDGWFTSSLGKDSQVMAVPVDGSGESATDVWTYMEEITGNLGNNLVDTPHAFGDRFYIVYNEVTGGNNPGAIISDYHFGSFALDGSDGRIEDEFDLSGPEPQLPPDEDAPAARISFEDQIA